eukprot:5223638-Amphidinium_carterae.1
MEVYACFLDAIGPMTSMGKSAKPYTAESGALMMGASIGNSCIDFIISIAEVDGNVISKK